MTHFLVGVIIPQLMKNCYKRIGYRHNPIKLWNCNVEVKMVLTIQNKRTTRKLDNCISLHIMGISGGRGVLMQFCHNVLLILISELKSLIKITVHV